MSDKAVIYLDCGDFHLVEGSHSFKIWVYLAAPGEALRSYERSSFTHSDLTSAIPAAYANRYPGLPYDAFVHSPHTWQNKVFNFLAENGIALDIEQLLSRDDYRLQLQRFGLPVASGKRTVVPQPAEEKKVRSAPIRGSQRQQVSGSPMPPSEVPAVESRKATQVRAPTSRAPAELARKADAERITQLDSVARDVLLYFARQPGDKVRYAANVLGVEARVINQALHGRLKGMCSQAPDFGWRLTAEAQRAVDAYQEREKNI